MLRISAGIIFYNDLPGLQRLMPTLLNMEKIYAIDGRFADYPSRTDLSDDGSREYLQSFSNVVIIDRPATTEVEKRNAYIEAATADNMDALLIIDTDEYIVEADWNKFASECRTKMTKPGLYKVRGWNFGSFDPWPRLVYPPKDFEYYIVHYAFRYKPTGQYDNAGNFSRIGIEGIKIMHDDKMRTPRQIYSSKKYQDMLKKRESGLLAELQKQNTASM